MSNPPFNLKRLVNLALLPLVVFSCKPGNTDQTKQNELESTENKIGLKDIVSEFPAFELDELVEEISQDELEKVVTDGESDNWTRVVFDVNRREMTIRNKHAGDNQVKFVLYGHGSQWAMLGVQQHNAQVSSTEVWEYHYTVNGDHPERWNQYLLPEHNFDDFFDENIQLPGQLSGKPAQPDLDFEMTPTSINISLNKWRFMRDLEANSLEPEGPVDPALVKYVYVLTWNGEAFEESKTKEAGYSNELTFTSQTAEDRSGCPHSVTAKTSSTLPKQGPYNYNASNVLDINDATAWSEGVEGDGVGEWIEFTITSNSRIGDSWQIANGYTRNKEVWQANGRVKKLKVLIDGQLVCYVMLSNVATYQEFNISPSWLKNAPKIGKGTTIRFVIEEVYKGSKFDDTLISYFVPTGNCR